MKKILIIMLLFLNTGIFAGTLILDECIDKAINTHPDIKHFMLQIDKSQRGVDVAQADYLPQISLNAEYDPIKTYTLPANGVFNTKDSDGWSVGGVVNQKIYDFSKTTSNIDAQKEQISIAELSLQDAKALLAYKVKLQYELMVVQNEAIEVRQKDMKAKEELYNQAKALVKQGMKTTADATRFLSSFYIAKDNYAISKASFDKARARLSLYINEDIKADVTLENTILNTSLHVSSEDEILQSSPALSALKKDIVKNTLVYKSTKASHYGSIDAIASYTHQDTLNEYDATLLGVTLKIPLYSGGRTSAFVQQAIIDKQNSEATYDSKILLLREEIESLFIDLKRYEKTIAAKKAQKDAATSTYELLNARYKEGLSIYIEVLDALSQKLDAELGLLSAMYEKSSSIHRLEYLQGKIR